MHACNPRLLIVSGVPIFLANAAISAWIKFYTNNTPPLMVAILHGLAIIYLFVAHARWFKHLTASREDQNFQVSSLDPSLTLLKTFVGPTVYASYTSQES